MPKVLGCPLMDCNGVGGCLQWAWQRGIYGGAFDSATWNKATYEDFSRVPQICRVVLASFEPDLTKPVRAPEGGHRMKLENIVKKVDYDVTEGRVPAYLIYLDHDELEIVLAIRGLNFKISKDYQMILDNTFGGQMFDGGYVHHGILKSAGWLLNREAATLTELVEKYPSYTLIFAGHSLGAGVAALMTVLVANNRDSLGKIARDKLKCFAIAPARCMSLNLAIKYADVIHSVVLQSWSRLNWHDKSEEKVLSRRFHLLSLSNVQDDFLPRTVTPVEDMYKAAACLPWVIMWTYCIDTCTSEKKKLKDARRLYAPGRLYHIVEGRRCCRCGSHPPEVRTSVPVQGRFNLAVLSCNLTSDHAIAQIEAQSQKALDILQEARQDIPVEQRMERNEKLATDRMNEYKAALERAVSLRVPFAFDPEDSNETAEGSAARGTLVDGEAYSMNDRVADGEAHSMNDRVVDGGAHSKHDRVVDGEAHSMNDRVPDGETHSKNAQEVDGGAHSKISQEVDGDVHSRNAQEAESQPSFHEGGGLPRPSSNWFDIVNRLSYGNLEDFVPSREHLDRSDGDGHSKDPPEQQQMDK